MLCGLPVFSLGLEWEAVKQKEIQLEVTIYEAGALVVQPQGVLPSSFWGKYWLRVCQKSARSKVLG